MSNAVIKKVISMKHHIQLLKGNFLLFLCFNLKTCFALALVHANCTLTMTFLKTLAEPELLVGVGADGAFWDIIINAHM